MNVNVIVRELRELTRICFRLHQFAKIRAIRGLSLIGVHSRPFAVEEK
jgi:hypothetical protein